MAKEASSKKKPAGPGSPVNKKKKLAAAPTRTTKLLPEIIILKANAVKSTSEVVATIAKFQEEIPELEDVNILVQLDRIQACKEALSSKAG
mmetsp:Transcript_26896/g.67617  ORF Transcript_26896/g.67617 Transcript_26896/m.67617 type:complete len:91 (+) Transcript_26896:161-433(+)|eukprot:CAMPEP_0177648690 /NCGR_PEP_ID=MMETSP0447-20121125/10962_1 /TAXON_ID=0 /ORGANISM="Stygamoeba regulata, Strain BSH-02190019" /LENGTH=90 /DNA_ID=CAMNT_0019151347 /DNA_START=200 /DNA_END=472 /DNA_ORIENTATION=-